MIASKALQVLGEEKHRKSLPEGNSQQVPKLDALNLPLRSYSFSS